jgi:hypothetical protein
MDNGKPAYTYNWFGLNLYTVKSSKTLPKGSAEVKLDFAYDGDGLCKGGLATLYVGGEKVAEGRIDKIAINSKYTDVLHVSAFI